MSDRIWMATVEAHNATLVLTGFMTEGEAWDVAALFVDALRRARPDQYAEVLSVEPDWDAGGVPSGLSHSSNQTSDEQGME